MSQTILYTNSQHEQTHILHVTRKASDLINLFFSKYSILVGQPVFGVGALKVTIHVSYYTSKTTAAISADQMTSLQHELTRLYGIKVILVFVRLTAPYLDATILSAYLSAKLSVHRFSYVIRRLFAQIAPVRSENGLSLPAYLVGIKIRLAGRLINEKSRPRITINTAQLGNLSQSAKTMTQTAAYTAVNIKGSYTVHVWLCSFINLVLIHLFLKLHFIRFDLFKLKRHFSPHKKKNQKRSLSESDNQKCLRFFCDSKEINGLRM